MLLKKLYRTLLPASIRGSRLVDRLKARLLRHYWIYNADFYDANVEAPARRSAGNIAGSILCDFQAASVVDVGCGTGALLQALRDRGCTVFGLEYSEAALSYCRARQLDVVKFDLEKRGAFSDGRSFDVAVSMEVGEHLPERVADSYVDLLARLAPVVVFTAAHPGQGGTDHVNEQPASYWIGKFRQRGFEHAEAETKRWSAQWQASGEVEWWYYQNLMIFRRG